MNFEDYNYGASNKYVLVDPNYLEDEYNNDPELSQAFSEDMQQ